MGKHRKWCLWDMANWDEIKIEWETTKITQADLAEKHGVKLGTFKSRKCREKWSRDATKKDATKTVKVATISSKDATELEDKEIIQDEPLKKNGLVKRPKNENNFMQGIFGNEFEQLA